MSTGPPVYGRINEADQAPGPDSNVIADNVVDASQSDCQSMRSIQEVFMSLYLSSAYRENAEGFQAVANAVFDRLGSIDVFINVLCGSSAPGGRFSVLNDGEWTPRSIKI